MCPAYCDSSGISNHKNNSTSNFYIFTRNFKIEKSRTGIISELKNMNMKQPLPKKVKSIVHNEQHVNDFFDKKIPLNFMCVGVD